MTLFPRTNFAPVLTNLLAKRNHGSQNRHRPSTHAGLFYTIHQQIDELVQCDSAKLFITPVKLDCIFANLKLF